MYTEGTRSCTNRTLPPVQSGLRFIPYSRDCFCLPCEIRSTLVHEVNFFFGFASSPIYIVKTASDTTSTYTSEGDRQVRRGNGFSGTNCREAVNSHHFDGPRNGDPVYLPELHPPTEENGRLWIFCRIPMSLFQH